MNPYENCTRCPLSNTRKRVVTPGGSLPANVLAIVDAPNEQDELLDRPLAGPTGRMFSTLIKEASELAGIPGVTSVTVPVVLCRPAPNGLLRGEVLKCSKNIMHIAGRADAKLVLLLGDTAKNFYGMEFPEAIGLQPLWWYMKHPSFWPDAVQSVADGMRRYLNA